MPCVTTESSDQPMPEGSNRTVFLTVYITKRNLLCTPLFLQTFSFALRTSIVLFLTHKGGDPVLFVLSRSTSGCADDGGGGSTATIFNTKPSRASIALLNVLSQNRGMSLVKVSLHGLFPLLSFTIFEQVSTRPSVARTSSRSVSNVTVLHWSLLPAELLSRLCPRSSESVLSAKKGFVPVIRSAHAFNAFLINSLTSRRLKKVFFSFCLEIACRWVISAKWKRYFRFSDHLGATYFMFHNKLILSRTQLLCDTASS